MNQQLTEQARAANEQKVATLMAAVERHVAERRDAEALALFRQAQAILPEGPRVLHEQARLTALGGDPAAALSILQRVVAAVPGQLTFWLSLAAVQRTLGLREEELGTLERALALNPTHLVVLLQKGALLDLMNRPRAAAAVYVHALQTLGTNTRLPPAIQAHVDHARRRVAENAVNVAMVLDARLEALRSSSDESDGLEGSAGSGHEARMRFERCLDRVLGRRRIYTPEPTGILFPFLSNYEFFPRHFFPWLTDVEAATGLIREELLAVLGADQGGIRPYIAYGEGVPLNQWKELNHSRRWGAYFLVDQGKRQDAHIARCPHTAGIISRVPQVDIPGYAPTAFFSVLEPHTRIPAHSGVTNTRVTVHLPLIVPPECRFRVGGETREWEVGKAWVFDDTIEHEAFNDSDLPRAILIFDVWNPQLTQLERDLIRETTVALAEFGLAEGSASSGRP
jgi:aspartate beta-hydroxylase